MERLFHSNHSLSCSGGHCPPSANYDDNFPPLATGIPKLQNEISKFGVANEIGGKKDKLSSFPVRHLFL